MATLFERLSGSQPPPAQIEDKKDHHKRQDRDEDALFAAQQLLDFVMQKWAKPTVSLRDFAVYGPRSLRKRRESVLEAAEILTSRGWLIPQRTARPDRLVWEIHHKPVLKPTVTPTPL